MERSLVWHTEESPHLYRRCYYRLSRGCLVLSEGEHTVSGLYVVMGEYPSVFQPDILADVAERYYSVVRGVEGVGGRRRRSVSCTSFVTSRTSDHPIIADQDNRMIRHHGRHSGSSDRRDKNRINNSSVRVIVVRYFYTAALTSELNEIVVIIFCSVQFNSLGTELVRTVQFNSLGTELVRTVQFNSLGTELVRTVQFNSLSTELVRIHTICTTKPCKACSLKPKHGAVPGNEAWNLEKILGLNIDQMYMTRERSGMITYVSPIHILSSAKGKGSEHGRVWRGVLQLSTRCQGKHRLALYTANSTRTRQGLASLILRINCVESSVRQTSVIVAVRIGQQARAHIRTHTLGTCSDSALQGDLPNICVAQHLRVSDFLPALTRQLHSLRLPS
ncbi:hypothetical protein J6590_031429 [Homalodisca vitripennis]|nr:hypothetical protein J6590_031429 [Homalodisca vitripennis]